MEPFTNAIGLWMFCFCSGMINIFQRQVQFILMVFPGAAVFSSAISKHSKQGDTMLFKEWKHPVVKHICGHQSAFTVVKLGRGNFAVSINKSLLIDSAYAFDGSHIISILCA